MTALSNLMGVYFAVNPRFLQDVDYLPAHPETVKAYGELKDKLAALYKDDSVEYTKAKTSFIQEVFDSIQDARGLPRASVWEE